MSLRRLIASLVPSPMRLPNPMPAPASGGFASSASGPHLVEVGAQKLLDVRLLPHRSAYASDHSRQVPGTPFRSCSPRSCEVEAGAGHQVLHGLGDEHLARARLRAHAGADVHRDAGDVVAAQLDLAGVEAGAHLETHRADRVAQRRCAQRIARPGPSKVARKPSPSVFTSRPR